MSTAQRRPIPGPVGFFFAAIFNFVGLVLINAHDWWRPFTHGVVTERFADVVWAANLSAIVSLIGNLMLMRWWTRGPRAAVNVVTSFAAGLSAFVTMTVFPFDLARFGDLASPLGHGLLGVAVFGALVSMLVNLVRLSAASGRRLLALAPREGALKVRVVYESIFGNTRDVALAIGKGLGRLANVEVGVTEVGAADPKAKCDLLVVGGPVHAWSMTRGLTRTGAREQAERAGHEVVSHGIGVREFLDALPETSTAVAAAFDTAGRTKWFPVGSAARPAARVLDELGYRIVARPEHFYVTEIMGPMLDGELVRAEEWGAALARRVARPMPMRRGTEHALQG